MERTTMINEKALEERARALRCAERMYVYYADLEQQHSVFCAPAGGPGVLRASELRTRVFWKLPLYRQSHEFTSGLACVQSVLRFAGYAFDTREDRLIKKLASGPVEGISGQAIAEFIRMAHLQQAPGKKPLEAGPIGAKLCERLYDLYNTDAAAQLAQALNAGPVICRVQARRPDRQYAPAVNENGHYVVAVGYSKGCFAEVEEALNYRFYFMDPSTAGSYTYLDAPDLLCRWHDKIDGRSKQLSVAVTYACRTPAAPIDLIYELS